MVRVLLPRLIGKPTEARIGRGPAFMLAGLYVTSRHKLDVYMCALYEFGARGPGEACPEK